MWLFFHAGTNTRKREPRRNRPRSSPFQSLTWPARYDLFMHTQPSQPLLYAPGSGARSLSHRRHVGSGIFRSPAGIADNSGPLPLVAGSRAALALCGALTLAEVGGAYPRRAASTSTSGKGGDASPLPFGWAELTVIRAAALGAIAMTFAEYFLRASVTSWLAPEGQ